VSSISRFSFGDTRCSTGPYSQKNKHAEQDNYKRADTQYAARSRVADDRGAKNGSSLFVAI